MGVKSTYPQAKIDLKKAVNLALVQGVSDADLSKIFNCNQSSIQRALKPFKDLLKNRVALTSYQHNKQDLLESAEMEMLLELCKPGKIKKAALSQLTMAFGTIYDKLRLERGQSTANIAYSDQSTKLTELDAEIQALEAELGVVDDDDGAE